MNLSLSDIDALRAKQIDPFVIEGIDDWQECPDGSEINEFCPYAEGTDGEFGWKKGWRLCEREDNKP